MGINNPQKRKRTPSLVFLAGRYVTRLLIENLPADLLFHNLHHTMNVVRGVRDIIKHTKVNREQREILLLAAWFHDTGLLYRYKGHEIESQRIATDFLTQHHYSAEKMAVVAACIQATQIMV